MPLYETIIICKPGASRRTMNLMKTVGDTILNNGGKSRSPGNLRDIMVLGDRLMARDLKGKDMYRYGVGRYVQFLYDSHPSVQDAVRIAARAHPETLARYTHRQLDLTDEAIVFRRTARMTTPIVSPSERNAEFLSKLKELKGKMTV